MAVRGDQPCCGRAASGVHATSLRADIIYNFGLGLQRAGEMSMEILYELDAAQAAHDATDSVKAGAGPSGGGEVGGVDRGGCQSQVPYVLMES